MVKVGTNWVRRLDATRVFTVRMVEGGTVYLGNDKGSTSSIPLVNFSKVWVEAPAPARWFKEPIQIPTVTLPPELLPLALEIQEARVRAEAEGSLRQRMTNVRTDVRPMTDRRVR